MRKKHICLWTDRLPRTLFLLFIVFPLFMHFTGNCDEINNKLNRQIEERTEQFFNTIGQNKIEEAFNNLLKDSPIVEFAEVDPQAMTKDSIIAWAKKYFQLYGARQVGFEQLYFTHIGSKLVNVYYIQFFDKYYLIWQLEFYNISDQNWIISHMGTIDENQKKGFFTDYALHSSTREGKILLKEQDKEWKENLNKSADVMRKFESAIDRWEKSFEAMKD